jgi:hypothetical protein
MLSYSYRSASIGSSLEAFIAGNKPAIKPTHALKATPINNASVVITGVFSAGTN